MKYLLIAEHPSSLPFAVAIDEQSVEAALSAVTNQEKSEGYMRAMFLIDMEGGEAKRMVRDGEAWAVSDTAYERNLGVATPDEYFKEAGTMEIAE
jgi:hypothetical protein